MNVKYTVYDNSKIDAPVIGSLTLDSSVGALELVELARGGYLNLVRAKSQAEEDAIRAEQERNEADLEDPEGALARTQAEIDAAAAKLPDGDYKLEDLRPKQLKALCEQQGLKTYGTGEDLLKRLQDHKLAQAEAALAAQSSGDVDLDALSVKELKEIARGYGVSDKGKKEAIIGRIIAAAEAQAAEEGDGEEDEDGEADLTDHTDQTDLEGDTPPAPPVAAPLANAGAENTAETAVPHSLDGAEDSEKATPLSGEITAETDSVEGDAG